LASASGKNERVVLKVKLLSIVQATADVRILAKISSSGLSLTTNGTNFHE
jgi:hypothetical protein